MTSCTTGNCSICGNRACKDADYCCKGEKRAESDRRGWAMLIAGLSLFLAATQFWQSVQPGAPASKVVVLVVLAAALATALVAGARALDGPMGIRSERRNRQQSDSAAAVGLWINSFAVIAAALIAAATMASLVSSHAAAPAAKGQPG